MGNPNWKKETLKTFDAAKAEAKKLNANNLKPTIVLTTAPHRDDIFPSARCMAWQVGFAGGSFGREEESLLERNPQADSELVCFCSDARSQKVAEIKSQIATKQNGASVLIWDAFTQTQIRLKGLAWVLGSEEAIDNKKFPCERLKAAYVDVSNKAEVNNWTWEKERRRAWTNVSPQVRGSFAAPDPMIDYDPGKYPDKVADIQPDDILDERNTIAPSAYANMCLIVIEVLDVEFYQILPDESYLRQIYKPKNLDPDDIFNIEEPLNWPDRPKRVNP